MALKKEEVVNTKEDRLQKIQAELSEVEKQIAKTKKLADKTTKPDTFFVVLVNDGHYYPFMLTVDAINYFLSHNDPVFIVNILKSLIQWVFIISLAVLESTICLPVTAIKSVKYLVRCFNNNSIKKAKQKLEILEKKQKDLQKAQKNIEKNVKVEDFVNTDTQKGQELEFKNNTKNQNLNNEINLEL